MQLLIFAYASAVCSHLNRSSHNEYQWFACVSLASLLTPCVLYVRVLNANSRVTTAGFHLLYVLYNSKQLGFMASRVHQAI